MNTLLKLYPLAWRRRYGDELMELLSETPFTATVVFDLLRGVADAWLHPSFIPPSLRRRNKFRQALLLAAIVIWIARPQLGNKPVAGVCDLGPPSELERTIMLADALIVAGSVLLAAILAVKGALGILLALYFSPDSRYRRRRMPRWLIVCILVSFLILPKIDTGYLAHRDEKKPAQVA